MSDIVARAIWLFLAMVTGMFVTALIIVGMAQWYNG